MSDWNVVVTIRDLSFPVACQLLEEHGRVSRSPFFNVVTLQVEDAGDFLEEMRQRVTDLPSLLESFGHIIPVTHTFNFQSPEEFEAKAQEVVREWIPSLPGKKFHVRMHRRGFKGRLSSQDEERVLDYFILNQLAEQGQTAHISFVDPDFVIAVETIGHQAGLSLWSRADRERYPFLHLD